MGDNITTTVQSGETLGLYASMYGCSVEDIKKANNLSGSKIKENSKLVIPIGKPPENATKTTATAIDKKLAAFDEKINEAKMKLYDTNLKGDKREKAEADYIKLVNQKKERDKVASFEKTADGKGITLKIKSDITVSQFRELFPECTTNFYEYAKNSGQADYINGKGYVADPDKVVLGKGKSFNVATSEYANQGFINELLISWGIKQ